MSEVLVRVLSALMIVGAQTPQKAIREEDIEARFGAEKGSLRAEIEALGRDGCLVSVGRGDMERVYLSMKGVIVASSAHS